MRRTFACLVASCLLLVNPARAQEPPPEVSLSASNLKLEGTATVDINGPLPLATVLALVERNHPKLRGADLERRIAEAKFLEKQGAFDPVLNLYSEFLEFNSTGTRGREVSAFQNSLTLDFPTPDGIKYFVGARFNSGSVKSPLSSTGSTGEYFVGIALPLLRDQGINEKAAALRQADLGRPIAEANFAETRLDLLQKAATSYWDWVAAGQRLTVSRNLLRLAVERAAAIRDRQRAGDLPAIDVVEANQEVKLREGDQVKAERDFQKEAFKFSLYLWNEEGLPYAPPPAAAIPDRLTEPVQLETRILRAGETQALDRRPELRRLDRSRDQVQIDLALARNRRLPQLDLYVSPGVDTGVLAIPGATLKVGLNFSLPLLQRTADGLIDQAQLKLEKIQLDTLNERQRILTQVGDSISAIEAAYQRFLIANQEVDLAEQMERGERDRFTLGDSTVFLVNQRERAAASARIKRIDAWAEYERSVIAYRAAAGAL